MRTTRYSFFLGATPYAVQIERPGGFMHHYYHFIMDLAWPLYHWAEQNGGWDRMGAVHVDDPNALYFADHFRSMLGKELRPEGRFHRGLHKLGLVRTATLQGFNSRVRDHMRTFPDLDAFRAGREAFVQRVAGRAGATDHAGRPVVVLIERAIGGENRGGTRRRFDDHAVLQKAVQELCDRHDAELRNVRLEEMDLHAQVRLLHLDRVVLVGQHGAGLLNGLWMRSKGTGVVELAAPDNPEHFSNLYQDLGVSYARLEMRTEGAYRRAQVLFVDPEPVVEAIARMIAR